MTQDTPAALPGELALIEKAVRHVGIKSLLNHGAGSLVYSEGVQGVTQEDLVAYTREIALHCAVALGPQAATSAAPQADNLKRLHHEIVEDRDALRTALELIAIGEAADPARDASAVLVDRGFWDEELADTHRAATSAAGGAMPPEWISDQVGGEFDDMTAGQGYRKGWNECRAAALAAQSPDSGAGPADLKKLRELVDVVWNEATESTTVPATEWADRLITKVFPGTALAQQGAQNG